MTDQRRDADLTTHAESGGADDHVLVRRVAAGDTAALATLYDRHAAIAHAVVYRVVRDHHIAEDLLQESFLRVWQHAHSYDQSLGRVRPWLLGIAHNLALNELRRQRRRPQEAPVAATTDDASMRTAVAADPDQALVAWSRLRQRHVSSALGELPTAQHEVIALYATGHSQSEIAAVLDQPLGTVKTRMRRGLLKMREMLAHEGFDVET